MHKYYSHTDDSDSLVNMEFSWNGHSTISSGLGSQVDDNRALLHRSDHLNRQNHHVTGPIDTTILKVKILLTSSVINFGAG